MLPKRFNVKFFMTAPVPMDKVVAVFQRWIQRQAVEGLLIDVADYHHVHNGPGVILIGDEGDYAVDLTGGRPGMMYTRKRQIPNTLQAALQSAFKPAIAASQLLQLEPTLGKPQIDFATAQITFLDRLNTPNTPEAFAALQTEITAFANALYAGNPVSVELVQADPREALTIQIKTSGAVDVAAFLERLNSSETVTS